MTRSGSSTSRVGVWSAGTSTRAAVSPSSRGAGPSVPPSVASEFHPDVSTQAEVCERLQAAGVGAGAIRALAGRWTQWSALAEWLPCRSPWTDEDVMALASMPGLGLEVDEMAAWVRLGPLQAGVRLTLRGILPDRLRQFPLDGAHGSDAFLKMLQVSDGTGMHSDDLLWWHTAGVLSLSKPFLVQSVWVPWRSAGATAIGMRRAALAAAAGLSPEAAIAAVAAGEDDEAAWRMLASLRAGQRL